jgi:hypothetical protein
LIVIGELDNEAGKFQVHIVIEAWWFLQLKDDGDQMISSFSSEDQTRFSMKKYISWIQRREFRDVHGKFYSKFNLHHFPTDIQELNVSIGSALFDTEVTLEADPNRLSGINCETFVDQQMWKLYDHIETKNKFIKDFLFQNDDDDNELETPGHERKRSISISELSLIENYRKWLQINFLFCFSCKIFLLEWLLSRLFDHNYSF